MSGFAFSNSGESFFSSIMSGLFSVAIVTVAADALSAKQAAAPALTILSADLRAGFMCGVSFLVRYVMLRLFYEMALNDRDKRAGKPSTHPVTDVDIKRLCGDVVRVRGGEEQRGARQIFRHAHAPERHRFADEALLLAERPVFITGEERVDFVPHRGIDDTWRNAVHVDLVRRKRE